MPSANCSSPTTAPSSDRPERRWATARKTLPRRRSFAPGRLSRSTGDITGSEEDRLSSYIPDGHASITDADDGGAVENESEANTNEDDADGGSNAGSNDGSIDDGVEGDSGSGTDEGSVADGSGSDGGSVDEAGSGEERAGDAVDGDSSGSGSEAPE
jgi:hypothetical protein